MVVVAVVVVVMVVLVVMVMVWWWCTKPLSLSAPSALPPPPPPPAPPPPREALQAARPSPRRLLVFSVSVPSAVGREPRVRPPSPPRVVVCHVASRGVVIARLLVPLVNGPSDNREIKKYRATSSLRKFYAAQVIFSGMSRTTLD